MRPQTNFRLSATVIWVSLTSIAPANRRTRQHPVSKIKKLVQSIAETSYFNPVLLDEKYVVIAGHARLEAAERLGMTEVPAIMLPGLSEHQKQALRIADNKLASDAKWDLDNLALELSDLVAAAFDVELTGFDTIDLDRLLTPPSPRLDEDEIPEIPARPVTQLGDCWQCGDHVIVCGNSLDLDVYGQLLDGRVADAVVADVPYNVPIPRNVSGLGKVKHGDFAMASGEMSDEQFALFLTTAMTLARDATRDGAVHYWFIDWRHIADMINAGRPLFRQLLNVAVWVKNNAGMGSFYRSQHEMVAIFRHGDAAHINNVQLGRLGRYRSNTWQYDGASSFSSTRDADLADHPTVKPIALVADAIRDCTKPGDLVLDPFGGSGTTMLAAQAVHRKSALIEIDPGYVDVTLKRFQSATGIEPVLQPDGRPFLQVRNERLGQTP